MTAPVITIARATTYARVTTPRLAPRDFRVGSTAAAAVIAKPATNADPPTTAIGVEPATTPIATAAAPDATAPTAAARSTNGAGGAAANAATKNGSTPATAVLAAPASARCRGSQA